MSEAVNPHLERPDESGTPERAPRNLVYYGRPDLKPVFDSINAPDLPPTSIVDLSSAGTEVPNFKGDNFIALQPIVDREVSNGRSVLLVSFLGLVEFGHDKRLYGTTAYKRAALVRLPFTRDELRAISEELQARPNMRDDAMIKYSKIFGRNHAIATLKHALEPQKLGTERAQKAVDTINQDFHTTFDRDEDQEKALEFLGGFRIDEGDEFSGDELSGVYCDIEGTLLNLDTREFNTAVLEKLKELDKSTFVHIWTGGDERLMKEVSDRLVREGVQWPVVSKHDFGGAIPEIVIDDMSQEELAATYRITPKSFIDVRSL